MKLKIFCIARKTTNIMKKQPIECGKYLQIIYLTRDKYSKYIRNLSNSTANKTEKQQKQKQINKQEKSKTKPQITQFKSWQRT